MRVISDCLATGHSFMQTITALDGMDMQVLSVADSEQVCSLECVTNSGCCGQLQWCIAIRYRV